MASGGCHSGLSYACFYCETGFYFKINILSPGDRRRLAAVKFMCTITTALCKSAGAPCLAARPSSAVTVWEAMSMLFYFLAPQLFVKWRC